MILIISINSFMAICSLAAIIGQRIRINNLEERIIALEKKTKDLVVEA